MADEEEERVLEEQLDLQLKEQRDSLNAIDDALSVDPSNPELQSVGASTYVYIMYVHGDAYRFIYLLDSLVYFMKKISLEYL